MNLQTITSVDSKTQTELVSFMNKVYLWMAVGLFITAMTGYLTYFYFPEIAFQIRMHTSDLAEAASVFKTIYFSLVGIQLLEVLILSFFLTKMSARVAIFSFLLYTFSIGLTSAVVFFAYTRQDISFAFFITMFSFICLSAYGFFTKKDLGFVGKFCMMGLFGLVGFLVYAFFVPSVMTDKAVWMTGAIGIIVFAGLTAYDTQKIKNIALIEKTENSPKTQMALLGALMLYLDFLNLFLSILRLMSRK